MTTLSKTLSDADKALAQQITGLDAAYKAADAQTNASLSSLQQTVANSNSSMSQRVDTVEAKADSANKIGSEAKAAAQTNSQAIATINKDGSTAFQALWSTKVQAGDIKAGIGIVAKSDGTSQVAVSASQFFVYDPNKPGTLVPTFAIDNGAVVIPKALIESATIQVLQAQKITADYVKAGIELAAPLINTGQLRGGDAGFGAGGPNNGFHTFVHSNGLLQTDNLQASNGYYKGTLEGARIVGNSEIIGATIVGATIITTSEFYWVEGNLTYSDGSRVLAAPYAVGPVGNYNIASYDFRAWKTTNRLRWATLAADTIFVTGGWALETTSSQNPAAVEGFFVVTYVNSAGATVTEQSPVMSRFKDSDGAINVTVAGMSFRCDIYYSVTVREWESGGDKGQIRYEYTYQRYWRVRNNKTPVVGVLLRSIKIFSRVAGRAWDAGVVAGNAIEVNNSRAKP
ncbi:phage tail protein [Vibrio cholerae]|nr:phage tail protein [Vibrio cholerae]